MLKINIIPCLKDNYSYIIYDKISKLVAVIDPSEPEPIEKFISKNYKKIDFILNTHHHLDHVGGNNILKKKYSAKIFGSEIDKERIPAIDILLKENDEFKFGNIIFEIISVPGHTKGHLAFYSKKEGVVFSGDALFSLGCGRIFEGTSGQMFQSIQKLKKLPKKTKIYCGHEYTKNNLKFCKKYDQNNKELVKKEDWINTRMVKKMPTLPVTVQKELQTNIFLRCDNSDIKNNLKMKDYSEELIFEKLRNLKDEF